MIQITTLDPMALKNLLWPNCTFYREQKEIIYSVKNNFETYVVAGNQLGDGPPLSR